ncbi:MAG TPA: DUF2911 domain-containing protein [Saprospiraceae bacterium]|nr:DUF2911 domain-containing protein [Saprospiraceae bacterium]HPN69278.1 DUF2911 domain-containing protein [Saprospiraceae bacterium]
MQTKYSIVIIFSFCVFSAFSQGLRIPQNTNWKCKIGRTLGATDIEVTWNAPGVKGREGKIWGSGVAPYGFTVLGYGSTVPSPWRAGADECTTISFSTDVFINGKLLEAGKYALFMDLQPDSTVLIFNKNIHEWGAYFYDESLDVLRVVTKQIKNNSKSVERLQYVFKNQLNESVDCVLEWEYWSIPFTISAENKKNILGLIKNQMSGALGFDPPSLQAAANWCLTNDVNFDQALGWINMATDPTLGGIKHFGAVSIKAGLLEKLGKSKEAKESMDAAIKEASSLELHQYGRRLLSQNKTTEAMEIFNANFNKNNGAWPTTVGLMRGYNAMADFKNALVFAKKSLDLAPDEVNKKYLESCINLLEAGKPLN